MTAPAVVTLAALSGATGLPDLRDPGGTDLTIAVALGAGLLSFLSPCVLPLVPAYLGQLTAVAVAGGRAARGRRAGWRVRHALAYVAGFGAVFTLLGITATFAAGPLVDYLPLLRQVGGILLIVMGLNLAGVLRIPALDRTWRPLEAGAAASLASATGTIALASAARRDAGLGVDRLGGRIVSRAAAGSPRSGSGRSSPIGWTPCIGDHPRRDPDARRDVGPPSRARSSSSPTPSASGIPFLVSPCSTTARRRIVRPLVRHGRHVSLIGGLLVVAIGVAMLFDWLALLPRYFTFNTAV